MRTVYNLLAIVGLLYAAAIAMAVANPPEEKPRFIVMGAEWCEPCRDMKNKVIPTVRKGGGLDHVRYIRFDVDKQPKAAAKAAKLAKTRAIPQLFLFWKVDGKWQYKYHVGSMSAGQLKEFLKVRKE
jgi:thiol:disulfide interchange protein